MKIKRPKVTDSTTTKVKTGCGNLYITITKHEGKLFEVFAKMGKGGSCVEAQLDAITMGITIGIRNGVETKDYIQRYKGIRCGSVSLDDGEEYLSCADAIAKVMEKNV